MSRNETYVLYGAAKGFVFNWHKVHLHFCIGISSTVFLMKVRPINFEDLKAALRQVKASVSSQVHDKFFSSKNLVFSVDYFMMRGGLRGPLDLSLSL
jgi:hypothetical protein